MSLTWESLVESEPALAAIERELRAIKADDMLAYCSNEVWKGAGQWPGVAPRLASLVGPNATHPDLRSEEAYTAAYNHLARILLPCRNCWNLCDSFDL